MCGKKDVLMKLDDVIARLCNLFTVAVFLLRSSDFFAETIPSVTMKNCKIDIAYTLNNHREITEVI